MKNEKRILIVEDETPLRGALRDKLTREDFGILEAKNGKEGLDVALRDHPDLIILNVLMPVMDGMTMLKKLREDTWGKTAKVIILTNLTSTDERINRTLTKTKSPYYLVKTDWKLEDIVAKIRENLGD